MFSAVQNARGYSVSTRLQVIATVKTYPPRPTGNCNYVINSNLVIFAFPSIIDTVIKVARSN